MLLSDSIWKSATFVLDGRLGQKSQPRSKIFAGSEANPSAQEATIFPQSGISVQFSRLGRQTTRKIGVTRLTLGRKHQ